MQITTSFWILCCGLVCTVNYGGSDSDCVFDGSSYEVGDVWHPILHPLGTMSCINCTCVQTDKVTCETDRCPSLDCESPVHVQDKCCPICEENVPSEVTPHPGERLDPHPACYHSEQVFEHNEVFASNVSAIKPTKANQCVLCICLNGDVICHLKTCLVLSCENTLQPDDDCCPVCIDEDTLQPEPTQNENRRVNNTAGQKDCHSGDETYKHGGIWHPVVGHFGQVNCVQCRCKRGEIKCRRLNCLSERELHCSDPQLAEGSCCRSCPHSEGSRYPTRQPAKRKKRRRRIKRRNNAHASTTSKPISVMLKTCPPKGTDILVNRLQNTSNIIWVLQHLKSKQEDRLIWTLKAEKFTGLNVESLPMTTLPDAYEIIGAIKTGLMKRLKKKAIKLWTSTCQRRGRCNTRSIQQLLTSLTLQEVDYKQHC